MKSFLKPAMILIVLAASLSGCKDNSYQMMTYEANVPVYMPLTEFRSSFSVSDTVEISHPGNIYFKDGYLFVNEYGKGIHVIDNSDPSNPEKIAFYEIIGNVDMAISGNTLYADSFIDLLAIDISDIENPVEIDRIENVFPEILPEGDLWYPYATIDRSKGVIVDWKVETHTEMVENGAPGGWIYREDVFFRSATTNGGGLSSGAGVAGSMARFMLNDNSLYLIAHPWMLKTVDVAHVTAMEIVDSVLIQRNMETLFRLEDKLFIGTTTGMLIFDITDQQKPRQISAYDHIAACDPVVVDGQYAYVTLRTGNRCNNGSNLLEVIDISSVANPFLVKSYPMFNPHGLGVDGDLLFICDGKAGLKVYDKSDPLAIITNQLAHYPDFDTFDVIPYNDVLMLIGEGGIYQYSYSDPENIVQISHIVVKGEK